MDGIRLKWPGGEHSFALRLGELRALQDARDAGPEEIFNRLRTGAWRIDDVIQTLRQGLVGGEGMTPHEAAQRVMEVIELHPLSQFKLTALSVLLHAILGPGDEEVGKPEGATTETAPENGNSPGSTATAQ